jgi:hypothetical protein
MRKVLIVVGGLVLLAAIGLLVLYGASQHVPDFYRQAMAQDRDAQKPARDRMLESYRKLNNDLHHDGQWQAAFTAEEINGWLALELPENQRKWASQELHDPRVAIDADGVTVAARVERGKFSSVVSLKVDVYLESSHVIAMRVRKVRAGAIPWSPQQVMDGITKAAQRDDLRLEWRQADGDPVALITIPPLKIEKREVLLSLDSVKLENGRMVVTGTAQRRKA